MTVQDELNKQELTIRDHQDPDKHWIGETLPAPSLGDLEILVGAAAGTGESPFPARADHTHKIDPALINPVYFNASPGATTDGTTSATMTTWLISSTFPVPTWATSAMIHVDLTNIYITTATSTTYTMTATISTTPGGYTGGDSCGFTPGDLNRHSCSFSVAVSGFAVGTQDCRIGVRRTGGTGVLRADTSSKVTGFVIFRLA